MHGFIIQTADRKDIKIERCRDLIMKADTLCPVISLVFYYGTQPWDKDLDFHRLLG